MLTNYLLYRPRIVFTFSKKLRRMQCSNNTFVNTAIKLVILIPPLKILPDRFNSSFDVLETESLIVTYPEECNYKPLHCLLELEVNLILKLIVPQCFGNFSSKPLYPLV